MTWWQIKTKTRKQQKPQQQTTQGVNVNSLLWVHILNQQQYKTK